MEDNATPPRIAALEKLLNGPRDSALLRYSLGSEWLHAGRPSQAAACLRQAVDMDRQYSAAWKLLGKALSETGDKRAALEAYREGIAVAEAKGDLQAVKEMQVFAKRLRRALGESGS